MGTSRFPRHRLIAIAIPAIFVAACAGSHTPGSPEARAKVFESEFGFPPPADVIEIEAKTERVGDTWSRWVRFKAPEEVFEQLVTGGFKKLGSQPPAGSIGVWIHSLFARSPGEPDWWKTPPSTRGAYYRSDHKKGFSASYHAIWRDRESGFIYSESSAWD